MLTSDELITGSVATGVDEGAGGDTPSTQASAEESELPQQGSKTCESRNIPDLEARDSEEQKQKLLGE